MSHKIIKPEGIELIEYLNNGYAICNRCGAVMRQTEDPKTGCGIYICPSCGLKMDEEEYWFILRDVPENELAFIKLQSDIEYIAMMSEIEL